MTGLLSNEYFDSYHMEEAVITTATTYRLEGKLHQEFFAPEEREGITDEYVLWSKMKPFCYEIIKGKRTPLSFSFVFHAPTALSAEILASADTTLRETDIRALVLQIRYDGEKIHCVTGTSLNLFTMDRSVEEAWDSYLPTMLFAMGVGFEVL